MWKRVSLPLCYQELPWYNLYILIFNIFRFGFNWVGILCGTPKPKPKYFDFKKFKPKTNRSETELKNWTQFSLFRPVLLAFHTPLGISLQMSPFAMSQPHKPTYPHHFPRGPKFWITFRSSQNGWNFSF